MPRVSAALIAALSCSPLLAGPYSPGYGASTARDAGIPGFLGPDGSGVVIENGSNYVNPIFKEWASGVTNYSPAPSVDLIWQGQNAALGPVTGIYSDVVALGDLSQTQIDQGVAPGSIALSFTKGIRNDTGADFAVFENGLGSDNSLFVELAYVEVSSNGTDFARFPAISLTPSPLATAYSNLNPTNVNNLAGKHANGNEQCWGTPFDLDDLSTDPLVVGGQVNLSDIKYVRFIDIPGTGFFKDSLGNSIYDPNVTWGSGGFDLEAVGVINTVPEPSTALCGLIAATLLGRRNRK